MSLCGLWLDASSGQGVAAHAVVGDYEPLEEIRTAAQDYVRTQLPRDAQASDVAGVALDERLRLAHCGQALRVIATAAGSAQVGQGHVTVGVSCSGPVHWTVYVPVTIETSVSVLVLRHAAARDSRLTPADVTIESRRMSGLGGAVLSSPEELAGRTLLRSLAAGTTLGIDMFSADLVVRSGQDVTLVAASGGIEVRAAGRALEDAAAGARVKVQNLSSLRVVQGFAESRQIVRIAQ